MKLKALAAGVAGIFMAGSALAATVNPAGPVVGAAAVSPGTTGSVDVTLTVPDIVRLSGLTTIALGTYTGNGANMTGNTPACVYRNGTGNYKITLTSANPSAGVFQLKDTGAGTNFIPYTVDYTEPAGGAHAGVTSGTQMTSAAGGGDNKSQACATAGFASGKIAVTVTGANLDAAVPANYLDTITVTVVAN